MPRHATGRWGFLSSPLFFSYQRAREGGKPQKAAGGNQFWQPAETPGDERQPENPS